jgi:hypothetical protein
MCRITRFLFNRPAIKDKKVDDLFVRVDRKKLSYEYKRYMSLDDSWSNNDKNNMLDDFILFYNEALLFKAKCQSIANIPNGRFLDTLAPGKFQIKCFVENRNYYGRIHGIVNAYDLDGQLINENSIETVKGKNGAPVDFTRWLIHDMQKQKPNPPNILTRVAWSAGCLIMSPSDLEAFNEILDAYKVISGELLNAEIAEE